MESLLVLVLQVTLDSSCASDCGCHGIYELNLGTFENPDHFRVYPGYILALEPGDTKVYYTAENTATDIVYEVAFFKKTFIAFWYLPN